MKTTHNPQQTDVTTPQGSELAAFLDNANKELRKHTRESRKNVLRICALVIIALAICGYFSDIQAAQGTYAPVAYLLLIFLCIIYLEVPQRLRIYAIRNNVGRVLMGTYKKHLLTAQKTEKAVQGTTKEQARMN